MLHLLRKRIFHFFSSNSANSLCFRACLAICKANSNPKSNLVLKDNSKSHILPVSIKTAIPVSVSDFCVSSTLSNSSDAMVQKQSFDSHSFKLSFFTNSASQLSFCRSKLSSPNISTTPESSISVSATNRNNFSSSIPYFNKSNDSKSACLPPQTSHLSPFSIKSSRRIFESSAQACQSIISQNQKVFNSATLFSLLEVSELPFQLNATATLPFTIIPLRSSAYCIFMLNLLFNFILLTCPFCFIFNFNILIYIFFTVLVFATFYINSASSSSYIFFKMVRYLTKRLFQTLSYQRKPC